MRFESVRQQLGKDSKGLQIIADSSFDSLPIPDIVILPGGFGIDALLSNSSVINWVKDVHAQSKWTVSVCSVI